MRIYANESGLLGVIDRDEKEPTEMDIDAINAMQEAEEAFELIMAHTARTKFKDGPSGDTHVRLALSVVIGAWDCMIRARAAAGY